MSDEEIQKLSFMEQSLSNIVSQRTAFQRQILEINNALEELKNVDSAYQITGTIMLKKSAKDLNEDLNSKKSLVEVRLKSFESQEKTLRDEMNKLRQSIMSKK